MRKVTFVILLGVIGAIASAQAKDDQFIGTSLTTLAGHYVSNGGILGFGQSIGIGPDGKVTIKAGGPGMNEGRFMNGKITYFSPAGFVVTFTSLKGPVEMKFVFQKGYPRSFFRDDGQFGVAVFTKQ